MSVYKDTKNNTWKVYYRFTDWQGKVHQSTKRGFPTKREALAWEREQLHKVEADLDMTFESFIDTYTADMKNRLKENTWHTKEHIIRTKLLPYFAKRKMNSIQPKDIIAWQNEMIKCRDKSGEAYSPVYLKTMHNQLSARCEILRAERQSRRQGRQYGKGQSKRNAFLDAGGIQEILRRNDGQACFLLCF